MKVAVVGATGLVGSVMTKVLQERNFPVSSFIPVASPKSVGNEAQFNGEIFKVISLEDCMKLKPSVALFSAGTSIALEWAPKFAKAGITVIDNSSAWRMHEKIPLIVPEINANTIKEYDRIIANPNCSTIQMVMALAPLHQKYKIKRIIVSTYQSVTGSGIKGLRQLTNERSNVQGESAYPYPIDLNVIPHGGVFLHTVYTTEEMKLVDETRKVLNDDNIQITATVVRVPVFGGHSESINVEFHEDFEMEEVRVLLSEAPGIMMQDDILNCVYPTPLMAEGKDEVYIGRLRRDDSCANALNMWVVSDNLRKGAATNAVQIAECVISGWK